MDTLYLGIGLMLSAALLGVVAGAKDEPPFSKLEILATVGFIILAWPVVVGFLGGYLWSASRERLT